MKVRQWFEHISGNGTFQTLQPEEDKMGKLFSLTMFLWVFRFFNGVILQQDTSELDVSCNECGMKRPRVVDNQ